MIAVHSIPGVIAPPRFGIGGYRQRDALSSQPTVRCLPRAATARRSGQDDKSVFIFGLNGYTSLGLGNLLASKGWSVKGTCRSASAEEFLGAKGWEVHRFDPGFGTKLSSEAMEDLRNCTHILSSIPPLGLPLYDPALNAQLAALEGASESRGSHPSWVGYLSSTSVYGDWGGEWVDESSPCRTASARGLVRLQAEEKWQEAFEKTGLPVHIMRLGGIYGPGRSAMEAAASAISSAGAKATGREQGSSSSSSSKARRARQKYTSRVHVADICSVLETSMESPRPGAVYNIVDDEPAGRGEVVAFAKRLLQGTTPEEAASSGAAHLREQSKARDVSMISSSGSSTGSSQESGIRSDDAPVQRRKEEPLEEKRVSNSLIKEELAVELMYPSYRQGLAAIHAGDLRPFGDEHELRFALA